jgi:filamentous hemagglutinin family protein
MNRNMIQHLTPHTAGQRALRFALYAAALASVILGAFSYQAVQAQTAVLPQGGNVASGQATINTRGNQMNITNTPGAVINWNSFNIGSGAGVNFQQQNANSSVMNRVTGGNISTIHGNLTSNGRVILVNPAGLVIGAGAVVDTAGFVGSAMNATEANAQLDRLRFDAAGGAGRIQVDGIIRSQSGDIVLVAPDITVGASALIQAPNGAVSLAAGQRVQLHGKGLDGITLELQAPTSSAINLGRIEGEAVGLFASQLRHSGIIDARQASIEGGRIVLKAADNLTVTGTITADGRTDAQGNSGRGGNITLEGTKIALQGANISASGPAGGGTVSIGGGWQGKDTAIRNASQTFVDQASQIKSNATQQGNGGQVVIWSDGDTWYGGRIEAKGGQLSGNGGQVEVSGKQRLGFQGLVNTGATNGRAGMLLLDPQDILVLSSGGASTQTVTFLDPGTSFLIDPGYLSTVTGDILLQANRDINVLDGITLNLAGGSHLTLEAGRSVFINNSINGSSGLNTLTVIANSAGADAGQRGTGLGNIFVNAGLGPINFGNNGAVTLRVDQPSNVSTAGGATLGLIQAKDIRIHSGNGIAMGAPSGVELRADRIELTTESGNIGSAAQPIVITSNFGGALSVFAPNAGSSAYIENPIGSPNDVRLAPGFTNTAQSANVNGTLSVVGHGRIRVGALSSETGSANIQAGSLLLQSNQYSSSQVLISQANGNPLNVNVAGNITLTAPLGFGTDTIVVGGMLSNANTNLNAGGSIALLAEAIPTSGIYVQGGGTSSLNLTQLVAGTSLTLSAQGDINVLGAQVGGGPSGGTVTINSTSGNINIEGLSDRDGSVQGNRVELLASSMTQGNITIAANGSASAAVTSGANGVQASAGTFLRVDSSSAAASETSRIEAIASGNVNLSATNIQITGGSAAGAKAEVATVSGGSVNVTGDDMTLLTGSGSGSGAAINSSGNVNATMTGLATIAIDGSLANDSSTGISAQNVNLNLNILRISATDGPATNSTYGITASNVVTVTATNNIVVAGSINNLSLNSAAVIYGGTGVDLRSLSASSTGIQVLGGDGQSMVARVQSGGNITLNSLTNLDVVAGFGNDVGAEIKAAGNINATAGTSIRVDAGVANNSSTRIAALGDVNLQGQALNIFATSGPISSSTYGVSAGSVVSVTTTGAPITVQGPTNIASTSTQAYIRGDAGVNLAVFPGANIEVRAGSGTNTQSVIQSNGDISLSGGPLQLYAGTGPSSSAIVTTSGNVSLTVAPALSILSIIPSYSQSHALIYAGSNSVTLATLYGLPNTLNQVKTAGVATPAILVPAPDISTTIALPTSLPVGSTGTGTITFTNLSPLDTSFTATVTVNGQTLTFPGIFAPANGTDTRIVVITSTVAGGTVSANVTAVTTVLGSGTLAESNLSNNAAGGIFIAAVITVPPNPTPTITPLSADISTTLALPSGAALGSSVVGTYTFVNTGANPTTFTYVVTINGVPTTQTLSLGPNASQVFTTTVVVGLSGAAVSINVLNSTVPETNTGNNIASGNLSAFITDVSSAINMPPSSAPAGSLVPVNYSFTNNSAFTTTFTPIVIINGVSTPLAPLTLGPGQTTGGTQNVMIAGVPLSVSIVAATSTFPELNLSNNTSNASIIALLPNVVTTVLGPNSALVGSNVSVTITYLNTGSAATQFTRTEIINGVAQNTVLSLDVGQSRSFSVNASVGAEGAVVSANAFSLYESNPSDNNAMVSILGIAPIAPPVITPVVLAPPNSSDVQPLIQNNQLQQGVLLLRLVPGGSAINTNNSGDTNDQLTSAREDIQVDGVPICRP